MKKEFLDIVFKGMTTEWVIPTGLVVVKKLYQEYANNEDNEDNFDFANAIAMIKSVLEWNELVKFLTLLTTFNNQQKTLYEQLHKLPQWKRRK